jgi:hypothetical protein
LTDADRSDHPRARPFRWSIIAWSSSASSADDDLHAGHAVLDRLEVAEVAVELVWSVFSRTVQVMKTTTSGCAPSTIGA